MQKLEFHRNTRLSSKRISNMLELVGSITMMKGTI